MEDYDEGPGTPVKMGHYTVNDTFNFKEDKGVRMTAEQIENFRRVLVNMIGPFALMMPDEEVVKMRDNFQARADAAAVVLEAEEEQDRNWCSKCGKAKTSRHVCI